MARTTRRTTRRATAAAATAALLAGVTLTGTLAGSASAVPGVPADAFDPSSVSWLSHRDQSSAAFGTTFAKNKKAGYLLTDLEIDAVGSAYKVGSVWQENTDGRAWREKRDLTGTQFATEWSDAKADGLRLVEQETYVTGGERRYAGVWVANTEKLAWSSHRGQTASELADTVAAARRNGLMPVDFDEYLVDGSKRYSTVWVENDADLDWKLVNDLTSAGWADEFDARPGYRVLSFDSLATSKGQRYGGIFVQNGGRKATFRRDMDATAYTNWWHRYSDMGYRMVGMDRYETANGTRYAAMWRQNSNRPTWSLRSAVDARVQQEIDGTTTPGVSVAIYQNGVAKYLRGFGDADVEAGEWMDSGHVGSIASVSKAVAGVLTMRMARNSPLDLDDTTRSWVPTMPSKHTHTVGDLLANRGCIHHYDGGETAYEDTSYATALAASKKFWNDALVDDCDNGEYNYSTHGYTLLGAALEAAGGDDVKDLVRSRLTTPYKLGTLGPQDFSSSVHRMSIYGSSYDEIDTFDNDWKVLGGGIDSSVTDLARFGAKLIGGQILTDTELSTMFTPPNGNSNYAYGWSTGTEGGTQVVAKSGAFSGNRAYLRMFPEKGIVVAVMANSRSGGVSAQGLGTALGSIVLNAK